MPWPRRGRRTSPRRSPGAGRFSGVNGQAEPGPSPGSESTGQADPAPSEEELRRRLDEELRKLRVHDVVLQSVVSLINLTSRRIGKEDERDLEQARVGIEAVRALVDLLEPEPATQVRNALSDLQVAYARAAGGEEGGESPPAGEEGGEQPSPQKPPPGLWTPPGSASG